MTPTTARRCGVATARVALAELADALGVPLPPEARPGADLWVRLAHGAPRPEPSPLLLAADGWVHPGPSTVWSSFVDMVVSLGAPVPAAGEHFPDLRGLPSELIDAEAGEWQLPAVSVRSAPAAAPTVAGSRAPERVRGSSVVVLGTAWAAPLVGLILAELGAQVVRVDHPRRPDPFPLAERLGREQRRVALDLDAANDRDQFAALLQSADLLVDGHTPRVRQNIDLGDDRLAAEMPGLSVLRIAAFAVGDRPGYGPAAECRGGWAARHDPPRLGRSSVADPVAGLLGALAAVELVTDRAPGSRARVALEDAVGHLLAQEARQ
ncbi:MAG: CoA transferase [Acidimicrobiia bacterium]